MKIAVVGAGIFGTTIALKLSNFHSVTIFEKLNDIMSASSRTNQLRLHRGYHYPRSPKTVKSLLSSIDFFIDEYKDAVVNCYDHFYSISSKNSLVSAEEYLNFCDNHDLEYEIVKNFSLVNLDNVDLTVKVKESLLDYQKVYQIIKSRLKNSKIKISLNTHFDRSKIDEFDAIINCTYADINGVLSEESQKKYQFEVCEKIVVKMPESSQNKSIVIMDGPFMCVDPYGRTGLSLLGNVVHAIHHSNVGIDPEIPKQLKFLLNRGVIKNPNVTNFNKFVDTGKHFIPDIQNAVYEGSMFTVRAVLPNMDKTDGRPTIIAKPENKIINVFSGKIDTCVMTANKLIDQLS